MKWEEHTDILQVYADAGNTQGNVTDTIFPIIPPCTLVDDYVQRFADHKEATGKNITVAEWIDCKNSTTKEAVKIDNILLDQCWRGIIYALLLNHKLMKKNKALVTKLATRTQTMTTMILLLHRQKYGHKYNHMAENASILVFLTNLKTLRGHTCWQKNNYNNFLSLKRQLSSKCQLNLKWWRQIN